MDANVGVLTVTWGGFRCRLEGFEAPMEALAEMVPWLAGARPDEGRGPASSRGAPEGVRREFRNGALILRPADAEEGDEPATAPLVTRPEDPVGGDANLGAFLGAPKGQADGLATDVEKAAHAPASAEELAAMGLGPESDARTEGEVAPLGRPAAPRRSAAEGHEAVLRLIRSQGGARREAAAAPPRPRRRPPGLPSIEPLAH